MLSVLWRELGSLIILSGIALISLIFFGNKEVSGELGATIMLIGLMVILLVFFGPEMYRLLKNKRNWEH